MQRSAARISEQQLNALVVQRTNQHFTTRKQFHSHSLLKKIFDADNGIIKTLSQDSIFADKVNLASNWTNQIGSSNKRIRAL